MLIELKGPAEILTPLLRGCGQMLFQPSAITGGVFLLLIFTQSAASLTMCLAGVLGSTLCAYSLEHPGEEYYQGLGGFNGGLLGLALSVFYEFTGALLVIAFAGGVLTGVIRVLLVKLLPFPPFTTPFIIVTWLVFSSSDWFGLGSMDSVIVDTSWVYGLVTNASQVLFLADPWVGAMVFAAVLLHSRTATMWVGAASLLAWLTALLFTLPAGLTATGVLGYNGLILAAALQHRNTSVPLGIAGVVLSVWLTYLLLVTGVTPLSVPFVVSTWIVIAAETVLARGRLTAR